MIEATDEDIAEALTISASPYTDEDVQAIKRRFHLGEKDWFAHDMQVLARTLAKLRVAVGALEYIAEPLEDYPSAEHKKLGDYPWMNMAFEQNDKALIALNQIRSE